MRRSPFVIGAVSLVVLSGCYLLPFLPDAEDRRTVDLSEIVTSEDSHDGTPFVSRLSRDSLASMTEFAKSEWDGSGGIPTNCYSAFALSFLVSTDDDGTRNPFVGIGRFDYDESEGRVTLSARLFESTESAHTFLDFVSETSRDCQSGYRLAFVGSSGWRVERITASLATDLDLPPDVTVVHRWESPAEVLQTEYRDSFVQFENQVVAINCEVRAASTFDFAFCDELAEIVAARMAEAR